MKQNIDIVAQISEKTRPDLWTASSSKVAGCSHIALLKRDISYEPFFWDVSELFFRDLVRGKFQKTAQQSVSFKD